MESLLDLSITLTLPPPGSPPEVVAAFALHSDQLGLTHTGDVLFDPLTSQERENLRWYLEEYPEWPYEQFLERARQIEGSLPELGKRLYRAVFGSAEAMSVVQAWRLYLLPAEGQRQISIISEIPRALSLPWELLHDEQGFLVLRTRHPVALIRRLPQRELAAFPTPFEPPLRILLVTARPARVGFVDPRSIARELLDEVDPHIDAGTIALEFLRPATLPTLRARLSDPAKAPIQILHFDGHGIFDTEQGQGTLAFEDDNGRLDLVKAEMVAQVLQDSGVRLAVLTACQSALSSSNNAFSSVAARLIGSGVDAVIAMGATVRVVSATRYAEAFYHALAAGAVTPVAQERARQALHDDPRRHLHRRRPDEEGTVVLLRDWWVSHYYQQRPVSLQPTKTSRKRKPAAAPAFPRLSPDFPSEPRYGFSGRARGLLQIERALLHKQLVAIVGFGGMGKTALVREAADWLTRTRMYDGACFVSFEHGGDTAILLSALGNYLNIDDVNYHPHEPATALARLNSALKSKKLLLVADNLESILPKGEVPLEPTERATLWDVLLKLHEMGVGVLLTSRDRAFGDGRFAPGKWTKHLLLRGQAAHDAYALASRLLTDLGIDRSRVPYAELRDLLAQLDHHPLAIQLVLPALRDLPLATIRTEFATILPRFIDDTETGRNHSLLASLDYSLRRLSEEQRSLLPRLAVFEGGASEDDLLAITEISSEVWATLRSALEQAALITTERVHEAIDIPFLRFHPVLVPYLRSRQKLEDRSLQLRYAQRYYAVGDFLYQQDSQHPQPVRALVRQELPNLRRALALLLQVGKAEEASAMVESIARFLTIFGMMRERDQMRQQIVEMMQGQSIDEGRLILSEYLHELSMVEDERDEGHLRAAITRVTLLLARIEAQTHGIPLGCGTYEHCRVLQELAKCLREEGQLNDAENRLREALSISDTLVTQFPEHQTLISQRSGLFRDLGDILREQGQYPQAKASYEEALTLYSSINDQRNQAAVLGQLGTLAALQGDYDEAYSRHLATRDLFHSLGEPAMEAQAWHNLGTVAMQQKIWIEAQHCYRESLARKEQLGDLAGAARTCSHLANVAEAAGRPAEAEGWYQRALDLVERVETEGLIQAAILSNLAVLPVNEVRAGRALQARLDEARRYMEQVQRIEEQPGISTERWKTFSILAEIAELEGQTELARAYRRRERESFAAFVGNRYHIDKQLGSLIANIAAATKGDIQARTVMETVLPDLEQQGWHITPAVRRIWAGERDWQTLVDELDGSDALLILLVLETLAEPAETLPVAGAEHMRGKPDNGAEEAGV